MLSTVVIIECKSIRDRGAQARNGVSEWLFYDIVTNAAAVSEIDSFVDTQLCRLHDASA